MDTKSREHGELRRQVGTIRPPLCLGSDQRAPPARIGRDGRDGGGAPGRGGAGGAAGAEGAAEGPRPRDLRWPGIGYMGQGRKSALSHRGDGRDCRNQPFWGVFWGTRFGGSREHAKRSTYFWGGETAFGA